MTKTLLTYKSAKVSIPHDMLKISSGTISPCDTFSEQKHLVVLIDEEDCSKCVISHLDNYSFLFSEVDVAIIFSPKSEDSEEILSELISRNFSFPVYYDASHSFRLLNPFFVDDERLKSVLVNKNMRVIFVGNPLLSNRIHELMKKHL